MRLAVRVTPRARRTEVTGLIETADGRTALAVKLAAPPVDGAANRVLISFLAGQLGLPRTKITIVAGEKSRLKIVDLADLAPEQIASWLVSR